MVCRYVRVDGSICELTREIVRGYCVPVNDRGTLVVHRSAGKGRRYRGRPDVRIDGRVRGQIAAGEQVEVTVPAGAHRVQVGREAFVGTDRHTFFGSPPLSVTIASELCTRVRVDPTNVPLRQQRHITESSYTLTEDTDGREGPSTPQPTAADLTRYPSGMWQTSPFTRSLLDRPRPWRSWQGGATAVLVLYMAQFVVALLTGHHPRNAFGWVWAALVVFTAVTTTAAWVSLYRVRHGRRERI